MDMPYGMNWRTTPGHGYLDITVERWEAMPECLKKPSRYYDGGLSFEEDLEYCRVYLAFPSEFSLFSKKLAVQAMRDSYPETYAELTGRRVVLKNSRKLRYEAFKVRYEHTLCVISARGSWADDVPNGAVGVSCVTGNQLNIGHAGTVVMLLISAKKYSERNSNGEEFNYVIDADDIRFNKEIKKNGQS